jgi:hypothetical protein
MLEKNRYYNLSEFCKVLRESQEFKAKKGESVDSENKKNNGKAVNDILTKTKEYDGGIQNNPKREDPRDTDDFNKTTLDLDFDYEPNDAYKAKVKAEVEGKFSAKNAKETDIEKENKGLDFEGNKKFYKDRAEIAQKRGERRHALKTSGLQSRELAKNKDFDKEFKDKTLFKQNESKMKRLHFNKTVFLNEEHMLKKIPDDMKTDGNKFYMKDSVGNEYLIECVRDKVLKDIVHTNIVDYTNKEKINETFQRMKELYDFKASDNKQNSGKYENKLVGKMISESKEKLFNKSEDPKDKFFKTLIGD